jgi:hypothetical protein
LSCTKSTMRFQARRLLRRSTVPGSRA